MAGGSVGRVQMMGFLLQEEDKSQFVSSRKYLLKGRNWNRQLLLYLRIKNFGDSQDVQYQDVLYQPTT